MSSHHSRLRAAILGLVALAIAGPASADPLMFSGNMNLINSCAGFTFLVLDLMLDLFDRLID